MNSSFAIIYFIPANDLYSYDWLNLGKSDAIVDVVQKNEGKVDPTTARRFLNTAFYNPELFGTHSGSEALAELPLETKLNLYEAVASEKHPNNAEYLSALNAELGLTKEFFAQEAKTVETFQSPNNIGKLEKLWRATGHGGSYAELRKKIATNQQTTFGQKKAFIEFTIKAYAKHCGLPVPRVVFYRGPASSIGYQQDGAIGINVNSEAFGKNSSLLQNVSIHEVGHMKQRNKGQAYLSGHIKPGHPDYIAARVFAANLNTPHGYISPDNPVGHSAYEGQAAEISARYDGELAVKIAERVSTDGRALPVANDPIRPAGAGFGFPVRAAAQPLFI